MPTFRSDNNAGICPEALDAMRDASAGHAIGYADDEWTRRAHDAFRAVLGPAAIPLIVPTGTAANCLAIASMTQPWQRVVCHEWAHYNEDESTAPEFFTGCRVTTCGDIHTSSKLTVADIERVGRAARGDVHQPAPGVATLSNPTEFGEVYSPDEMRALCDCAHDMGYLVHVDGARFANAVAHVASASSDPNAAARALTTDAGLDALSFGGTKNGLALGEAIIFFQRDDNEAHAWSQRCAWLRKRAGHLLSKHRLVSAPFAVTLETGAWVRYAAHANRMAALLEQGLASLSVRPRFPVQSNGVFAVLDEPGHAKLERAGIGYYRFGPPDLGVARLMCSFDTAEDDVRRVIDALGA